MPIKKGIIDRTTNKMTDMDVFSFLYAKSKFRLVASPRIPRLSICVMVLCTVLTLLPHRIHGSCMSDGDCGVDGVCERGSCVCAAGWSGDVCDHCQGRTRLEESSGYIIEALDDYQDRRKCTWLIDGGRPGANIRFILQEFGTECSWDYLYIYDGDSIYAPLVASLNGPIIHDTVNINHEILTTSGFAYLYFYSDAAFSLDGFNISYSIESCPGNGCSGHGNCSSYHLNCSCDPLWLGEACNIPACPSNCSGLGYCDPASKACVCPTGYKGRDCGTLAEDGIWEIKEGAIGEGRGAASTILIGDDLWVVGGYTYNEKQNLTVSRYNIPTETSLVIDAVAEYRVLPRPRFSHSTVLYEDKFYMFGGSLSGSGITAEMWSFDLASQTWTNMTDGPHALEGHSAHVIDDVMVVFFGYSPIYSYINLVQEYNITSGRWSEVRTRGAAVVGAYGHSSVYHPESGKIYIHGGFKLKTGNDHMLSDQTYQYDVNTKSWLILKESLQPRFFHSAVILNGLMLVFGGNTHTDNTRPNGAKCYSKDFLAYNLECASWEQIEMTTGLHNEVSLFAHRAFIYQESMWIYSGYNGLLSTSALLYIPGNCSVITNSSVCVEGLPGLWCVWDLVSESCVSANSVPELATNHSTCPIEEDPQCGMISTCQSCVEAPGCGFCNGNCSKKCANEISSQECEPPTCSVFYNCRSCNSQNYCQWSGGKCQPSTSGGNTGSCSEPCGLFDSCSSCLSDNSNSCMWCQSQERCVDSTTYMTSFPFGLCLEWRTNVEKCPKICTNYQTCQECQGDPACGWCDGGNRDGLGACMEGSYTGPVNTALEPVVVDYGMCPAQRWYFVQCPSCQCNGHSTCPKNSSECGLCQDYTEGEKCDTCQLGYYGRPQNGGECNPCSCNGHSDICHQTTGQCYCDAKGVTGNNCDRCETNAKYYGNPINDGYCYYKLLMNWQYTFNLSDEEDKNHTRIAMMTAPNSPNRDIEFILRVDSPVYLNITYTAKDVEGEQTVVDGMYVESTYRRKLSRYEYDFSMEGNTTFYFYLSNFTTPMSFEVFLIHPMLMFTLLQFLIVFFSCFLFFLLFFVLGWKFKQRCDAFRNRQQRAVEMAVMASRPFAAVNVEVSKSAPPDLVAECQNYQVLAALEPCSDNKAGIMTVFLQLPMPDGEAPPLGQPRLALASALVQLKPKKAEMKEQRDRERDARERERENRAREREQREREREQETQQRHQQQQQLPVAPLAAIQSDDALSVSVSEDARHIRHHADHAYDNPAMV
ncbi:attractin-like protein 1 isoform X3 [Strongylocentrotus purpuratus]|uniref:Attractin n=1 Tax=Strongylocentrotus purpuratus TaxID=7668 RepID=A0A7M7NTR0_STRPU|nr:attractin-like protein 1 isoform X3 [Strongylocentrotus purpuratus]